MTRAESRAFMERHGLQSERELREYYSRWKWAKQLREQSNDCYLPLFACEARFLVLKGGGGSGKSIFAGRKILERCARTAGHKALVCRKVAATLKNSCVEQLIGQLGQSFQDVKWTLNKTDYTITFGNGSQILFKGLDDIEKLKSIYGISMIWIEEASEISREDFNQLDIRLRDKTDEYKQMILTFNPVSVNHWLKDRFFDNTDKRAVVSETDYHDNRFLTDEAIATLEGFRESDPYYYQVYCLGNWGTSGRCVFHAANLQRRLEQLPKDWKRFSFCYTEGADSLTHIKLQEQESGIITIYQPPREGVPYVIGADTAGEGSDRFAAHVIDNITGEQVAVLWGKLEEGEFTRQIYCLGLHYNTALIGIERNFSSYPIRELERLRYPKQYVRETLDDYTHRPKKSYGFVTDRNTRATIIAEVVDLLRDYEQGAAKLYDRETILEMLSFVRNKDFRPEAEAGAHDDLVMSYCIAQFIRTQQRCTVQKIARQSDWTREMRDDYKKASAAEKRRLRRMWNGGAYE